MSFHLPPPQARLRKDRVSRRAVAGACAAVLVAAAGLTATEASAAPTDPTQPPGTFSEQNLAADRTGANFFYRIPALAHLGDGVVLAAWDARPGSAADSPNPNSIVQRRSTDGGRTWGPMTTIAAGFGGDATTGKDGYSDPSYVVDAAAGKVFAFFVHSHDVGFAASEYGNDEADRKVIKTVVVESSDGGLSWSAPRSLTKIAKPGTSKTAPQPGDVRSMFASSGEGIQLTRGAHAGRLLQQYAGYVRQQDGSEVIQAWSLYSDDHGATWHRGEPVGVAMDENKVVELSDGTVMLNSRDNAASGFRKVAVSTDGGVHYGPVTLEPEQPDPANNASITQMFPGAPAGSPEAKKLLFTNSASRTERENVSARVSCDDGRTWPGVRRIRSGFSAYSTATRLDGGRFGVFYEANYTSDLAFASFDDAWLNYVCAPMQAPDLNLQPGGSATAAVTISNQEQRPLAGATLTLAGPAGWSSPVVPVPELAPGADTVVAVPVTAPANAGGTQSLTAMLTTSDGRTSQGPVKATLPGQYLPAADIVGSRTDTARDLASRPYAVGEQVPYQFAVASRADIVQSVVPTEGNFTPLLPPGAGNCRYTNLPARGGYTCTTPRHQVTAAELAAGFFVPRTKWQLTAPGKDRVDLPVTGDEVDLLVRRPALQAGSTAVFNDVDGDGLAGPGDTVAITTRVRNTGNVTVTGVHAPGLEAAILAAGEQVTAVTRRPLTDTEIATGLVGHGGFAATAANGAKPVQAAAEAAELVVPVAPPTTEPPLVTGDYSGPSPIDLELADRYRPGDQLQLRNLTPNRWYHVHLNRSLTRVGWVRAGADGRAVVTMPDGARRGLDWLVVRDLAGADVAHARLQVLPRGAR